MAQIVDETKQAELIAAKVSTTSGTYQVLLTSLIDNANRIVIGNSSGQNTELDPGDSMDVPGDALGKVYCKGTPPGWSILTVVQGSKQFKFLGDQTARILTGDQISIVGSTGNDGFYTVVSATFGTGQTTVTVEEALPDDTNDGDLFHADKIALFAKG